MFGKEKNTSENLNNTINVYWAPSYFTTIAEDYRVDWNMYYYDPVSVYDDLKQNANEVNIKESFFSCPAFAKTFKNTYTFKNPIDTKFIFNQNGFFENNNGRGYINIEENRKPSLINSHNFMYNLRWVFFADQPLSATFTSPYLHKPGYSKDAALIAGEMDIGRWFRVYNLEMSTYEIDGEISFKENEPLFYAKFNTDKNINMVRFKMTDQIMTYAYTGKSASGFIEPKVSINKRYDRFIRSRTNDLILKEIRDNIL